MPVIYHRRNGVSQVINKYANIQDEESENESDDEEEESETETGTADDDAPTTELSEVDVMASDDDSGSTSRRRRDDDNVPTADDNDAGDDVRDVPARQAKSVGARVVRVVRWPHNSLSPARPHGGVDAAKNLNARLSARTTPVPKWFKFDQS